ncbi:MAG: tetratricopeptide repeat protein [Phycisphaerales bacterium]|nr:tetratricopeptide repeat protein [Phycisphaerales bacterium]
MGEQDGGYGCVFVAATDMPDFLGMMAFSLLCNTFFLLSQYQQIMVNCCHWFTCLLLTGVCFMSRSHLTIFRLVLILFLGMAGVCLGKLPSAAGATAEEEAVSWYNRGVDFSDQQDYANAIDAFTRVIELPGAPVEQVAKALVNRGVIYGQQGQTERKIADYTRVIELPGAPAELVAQALVNRGVISGQQGQMERAIADWSRAIELPGAPAEPVAMALVNRGAAYVLQGQREWAIADFTRAIELPGAPAEQVVKAKQALKAVGQ